MRILAFCISLLLPAGFALAETCANGFCPIQPIPNIGGGGLATASGLSEYLDSMFQLAIAAGAALAVLLIAIGGFEYIFSEAVGSKHDGKQRILSALFGLAILLTMTMILYVINPDAICLEVFSNNGKCSNP